MKTRSNDSAGSYGGPTPITGSQLLVSVRSEQEVDAAIAGGADIVDLKEPRHGALAPTGIRLWQFAARRSCETGAPPFSAALGEASDAISLASSLPAPFRFAKVGPSGHDTADQLCQLWRKIVAMLQPTIELVAVAYADHESSGTLPPEDIFALAADFGLKRCLIDTFGKDGRSTINHLGQDRLVNLASIAAEHQLWWSMAGSIRLSDATAMARHRSLQLAGLPNCYGVRGDLCSGGRDGDLSIERLRQWKASEIIQPSRVPLGS